MVWLVLFVCLQHTHTHWFEMIPGSSICSHHFDDFHLVFFCFVSWLLSIGVLPNQQQQKWWKNSEIFFHHHRHFNLVINLFFGFLHFTYTHTWWLSLIPMIQAHFAHFWIHFFCLKQETRFWLSWYFSGTAKNQNHHHYQIIYQMCVCVCVCQAKIKAVNRFSEMKLSAIQHAVKMKKFLIILIDNMRVTFFSVVVVVG